MNFLEQTAWEKRRALEERALCEQIDQAQWQAFLKKVSCDGNEKE